jgi:hypothetical protein
MEMKDKRTKIAAGVLALAGLLSLLTLSTAGNLEPNAPPGPTMKTLDEIYDAVIAGSSGVSERQGYWKDVNVGALSSYDFFTVQTGKQFVLLKVTMRGNATQPNNFNAYLTDGNDGNFSMSSRGMRYYEDPYSFFGFCYEDFPDRCVVVNAGSTLRIINNDSFWTKVKIVGYFYDVP